MPEEMPVTERRLLHYSETDMNGHINNTRYADFASDAMHLERLKQGQFVCEMSISFLAECRAGETLEISAAQQGDTGFVRGTGHDGQACFEAVFTLK